MKFEMPYGKSFLNIEIPDSANVLEISPKHMEGLSDPKGSFIKSLDNPTNSAPLKEIIKEKKGNIVIVVDDHTRKFPNKIIIPIILEYISKTGISKEKLTFLMASSTHKAPTQTQIDELFGNILDGYKLVISDQKRGVFRKIGVTTRGTPVLINEIYLNASIRILLTDITMHYFAGFGGDRKSILPGIAAAESVDSNHIMTTMQGVKTGRLKGNPIHEDMLEGARFAKPDFVVNVCVNEKGEIFFMKCGALNDAFLEAVSEYKEVFEVVISDQADLLIISQGGYPSDISYYQSMKSLHHCLSAVKKGGKILFLSECREDLGSAVFLEWIEKFSSADEVAVEIKRNFKQGANSAYFQFKFVDQYLLYIKTEMSEDLVLNTLKMTPVDDIQITVDDLVKESKKIYVIRNGTKILVSFIEKEIKINKKI